MGNAQQQQRQRGGVRFKRSSSDATITSEDSDVEDARMMIERNVKQALEGTSTFELLVKEKPTLGGIFFERDWPKEVKMRPEAFEALWASLEKANRASVRDVVSKQKRVFTEIAATARMADFANANLQTAAENYARDCKGLEDAERIHLDTQKACDLLKHCIQQCDAIAERLTSLSPREGTIERFRMNI